MPNELEQKRYLMTSKNPLNQCYDCVRNDIIENNNHYAIILLAAYEKEDDIDLIIENMEYGSPKDIRMKFAAFRKFQHPELFNYLESNISKYYHISSYLGVVAGYQNEDALNILNKVFEIPKDNVRRSHLKNALISNFTEIYADLLFQVLEEELSTYFNFPDELWIYDKERSFNLLMSSLEKDCVSACGSTRRPRIVKRIEDCLLKNAPEFLPRFHETIND